MKVLFTSILFAKAAYDYSPLVPMDEYGSDYRTLNVWECFAAKGKFCVDKNYKSMMALTGSSNRGHGLCCKTSSNSYPCNSDDMIICSQPAEDTNTTKWEHIQSRGNLNY